MNYTLLGAVILLSIVLALLIQVRETVAPIARGIITGLAANAQKNAMTFVLAMFLAVSASIGSFIDNFGPLDRAAMDGLAWWQVTAVVAKCINPGIVAIIGLLMKSPLTPADKPTGTTTPPFPPAT